MNGLGRLSTRQIRAGSGDQNAYVQPIDLGAENPRIAPVLRAELAQPAPGREFRFERESDQSFH